MDDIGTLDALSRHAAARPDAVAVVDNGRSFTYATITHRVAQLSQALLETGLEQGQVVGVAARDSFLHLLLLLAADRQGLVALSFTAEEIQTPHFAWVLDRLDLAITNTPIANPRLRRNFVVTSERLASIFAQRVVSVDAPPQNPAGALRIVRTSGTTGTPKRMAITREVFERRLESWVTIDAPQPGQRVLLALPLVVWAGFVQAHLTLRLGGTLIIDNRMSLPAALVHHRIDRVTIMPLHFQGMLDQMGEHPADLRHVTISTVGGAVPPVLWRRVSASGARIQEVYSGNEMGNIAVRRSADDSFGSLLPGIEVRTLDAAGQALPAGSAGTVSVRAPYMIPAYLDDDEATAHRLKDGWFLTGDSGVLQSGTPRRLRVLGRADDALNLGGYKIMPHDLENLCRAAFTVRDIAVCALPTTDGLDEVWVALVYDAPTDDDAQARFGPALQSIPLGRFHAVRLALIPRTATGKIQRNLLKQQVAEIAALAHGVKRDEAGGGGAQ